MKLVLAYGILLFYANFANASGDVNGEGGFPTGAVMPFVGRTVPEGWLICDGQAVHRDKYLSLFNIVGTRYGKGDGENTFNKPDLRGRTVIGQDTKAEGKYAGRISARWPRDLGRASGEGERLLSQEELPAHAHYLPVGDATFNFWQATDQRKHQEDGLKSYYGYGDTDFVRPEARGKPYIADADLVNNHYAYALGDISQTVGGGAAHSIVQPSAAAKWMIKY